MIPSVKSSLFLGACTLAYALNPAIAAEIAISDEQTDPVATSTIDSGAPGDILIETTGSIEVVSGTAVTIDSDNYVINEGLISVEDVDDGTGVFLTGGLFASFSNSGNIFLAATDDETRASGKYGIRLTGPGVFTGDITNDTTGSIRIGGDSSFGISLETALVGDLTNLLTINLSGSDNTGVFVGDTITGTFTNRGSITSQVIILDLDEDPETIELFYTNQAVAIGASISGGFLNDGLTKEEEEDDIEDDNLSFGSISTTGAPQAVLISPTLNVNGPSDIFLGAIASKGDGQGFINLGAISANAQQTIDVEAVRIEGFFDGFDTFVTDLAGGFRNDGSISATAISADATGLAIGEHVVIPDILNNGSIVASSTGDDDTYHVAAISISTDADSVSLTNIGIISALAHAETGTVTTIDDTTGALSYIYNSGTISSWLSVLNDDGTRTTGTSTAIDLTANTTGVMIVNEVTGNETDGFSLGRINGDILFGSGNDTFMLNSGDLNGDLSFGVGADYFYMGEDATFDGFLISEYGTASADIYGTMTLDSSSTIYLDDLTIGSTAQILIPIDPGLGMNASFDVVGTATIESGASFIPVFQSVLTEEATFDLVTGGTVLLPGGLPSLDIGEVPYLYNMELLFNTDLQLTVSPKTAVELGLSPSLTAFYDPLLEALNTNDDLITSIHSIQEKSVFDAALLSILPDDTNANFELGAIAFRNIAYAATSSSLATARKYRTGQFWATESGFFGDQSVVDGNRGYSGNGFQMAGGYEISNGFFDQLGLSVALSSIAWEPDGSGSKPYKSWTTWFSGYGVTSVERLKFTAFFGYGSSEYKSSRLLLLDNNRYSSEAEWSGTQQGVYLEAKYRFGADDLYIDPYTSFTYLSQDEDDYVETGDLGIAISASENSQSGFISEVGSTFGMETQGGRMYYTTELTLGWRNTVADSEFQRDYQFVEGTLPFTLYGPNPDESAGVVGLSIFAESNMTKIGAQYLGAIASEGSDHRLQLVLKWRF